MVDRPAVAPVARPTAGQAAKRAMRLPAAHRFRLAWRLARSRDVPWRARLPLVGLLIYLAMPLDIIPDFIPVLGQLDDLLVAGMAVWWFLRVCPPAVAQREIVRLEQTPLGPWDRRLPRLLGTLLCVLVVCGAVWLFFRIH